MIAILIFTILVLAVAFVAQSRFRRIYLNIKLGKNYENPASTSTKLKNLVLIAFGQKKMFSRPIPAIFHFFIYAAFLLTQVELIEILLDGFTGSHRLIGSSLSSCCPSLYSFLINFIEILNALAFVATVIFLSRRNLIKLPRLNMAELKGWPMRDANLILIGEIILVFGIFLMNTSESVLVDRGHYEYKFWLSSMLAPLLSGLGDVNLHLFMQIGWWLHLLGILGFILYLPFSKHLHIFLAFPNAYLSSEKPKGYVAFMPEIFKEIQSMMNPEMASSEASADIPKFGARDVFDLSQKNLLDAYSCTECGRCSSACPASQTGKLLSPRKIMMDTRDRLEEVGRSLDGNKNEWKDDGKSLLHDYISVEELRGCNTCNACVEECPVNISPLDIIIQLRRNLIMEESNSPQEWNGMFGNIENNGAPWKFAQSDRGAWVNKN